MIIDGKKIGNFLKPYVIAEVSCNHGGSLNAALEMIEIAKWAGADAVKFQAYTPDTITVDCNKPDFIIQDGLWKGKTLYELYKKTYTPFDWFPQFFKKARKVGITLFASVFDRSSIEMLDALGCPAFKIASMEITDTPLIAYAASRGKPVIISTGMGSQQEISAAYAAVERTPVAFLHCTSEYPQTVEWSSLNSIPKLRDVIRGDVPIGVSDHTNGYVVVPVAATAMGAAIIEKHLKIRTGDTEDEAFSLAPDDFKTMVKLIEITHEAMQERQMAANPSRQLRRSLYAVADIKRGETFTEANLRSIRPGFGISPKHLPRLLGKRADKDYRKGDRIT